MNVVCPTVHSTSNCARIPILPTPISRNSFVRAMVVPHEATVKAAVVGRLLRLTLIAISTFELVFGDANQLGVARLSQHCCLFLLVRAPPIALLRFVVLAAPVFIVRPLSVFSDAVTIRKRRRISTVAAPLLSRTATARTASTATSPRSLVTSTVKAAIF